MPRIAFRPLVAAVILTLSGCTTTGSVQTENIAAIRSGVAATRQQAGIVFTSANDLARSQAIARKIRLPEQVLRQRDFPEVVPADSAREWNTALGILDDYAAALQSLVAPQRGQETGNAIGELGEQLNGAAVTVPPGLVGIVQAFGQALVQAQAERKAMAIMRTTDPDFQALIGRMATAIGQPDEPGSLTSVVASNWDNSVLPLIEDDYGMLPASDVAGRRQIATSYVTAMGVRDRQIGELIALQRSLLAIGEAHRSAAQGSSADALFWIQRINGWVDDAKARIETAEQEATK